VAVARGGRGFLLSFLAMVIVPLLCAAAYLYWRAVPQYESTVGFSVRREEAAMPVDFLGGFAGLSGSGSADADILHAYLSSQELVAALDRDLDLRGAFALYRAEDPVFAFREGGTIEDLVTYWGRMTRLSYDAGTGLIELRVRAFEPALAQDIAAAAFGHSQNLINALSAIARDDILDGAKVALDQAGARLRAARGALTAFRTESQIVDPGADVSGQMGLLTRLQAELADELIRLDLLENQTRESDPRIAQSRQRIAVIDARIATERQKIGSGGGPAGEDYASVMAEFERLSVDVEFARESYLAALAAHDLAVAEARRQTRYLAAHIKPTLAERATAPDPAVILGLGGVFLVLIWAVSALTWSSLRDRQ
jgi:capsular polysaccharide transport system permease protein